MRALSGRLDRLEAANKGLAEWPRLSEATRHVLDELTGRASATGAFERYIQSATPVPYGLNLNAAVKRILEEIGDEQRQTKG